MESEIFLAELATKLREIKARKLATQQEIAEQIGINQPTISRALNGRRTRATESLDRLMIYADMLLGYDELPTEVQQAAREFLGRGGSEAELIASIEHSAKLVSRKLR